MTIPDDFGNLGCLLMAPDVLTTPIVLDIPDGPDTLDDTRRTPRALKGP